MPKRQPYNGQALIDRPWLINRLLWRPDGKVFHRFSCRNGYAPCQCKHPTRRPAYCPRPKPKRKLWDVMYGRPSIEDTLMFVPGLRPGLLRRLEGRYQRVMARVKEARAGQWQ